MELFPFIDALFSREAWREVTEVDKRKYCFLVMRVISVKYPHEANLFNIPKVNQAKVMDAWHAFLCSRHSVKPQWMFAPQSYKGEKKDNPLKDFPKKLINSFLKDNGLDRRDFDLLTEIEPGVVVSELKSYKAMLKENGIDLD